MSDKVIAIFSGGLDSTTLVYDLILSGFDVECISFNYGQKHKKELKYAEWTTEFLKLRHDVVDLSSITSLLAESGSSLVASTSVPEGHYAQDNMKTTVVPNRNMIMLAVAGGIAVARGARGVATGVHAGDHFVYPDCRPTFIEYAACALYHGNEGFGNFDPGVIIAPYMYLSKEDIAYKAIQCGVPFDHTWSCYKGGKIHCGKCGTCVERLEAIDGAIQRTLKERNIQIIDTTVYEDRTFWKTATPTLEEK